MAQYQGGVKVTGYICPTDTSDNYATHWDILGKGGIHSVLNVTERDAIQVSRRSEGMLCFLTSTKETYQLIGGINNTNWQLTLNNDGGGDDIDYPGDPLKYLNGIGEWAIPQNGITFPNDISKFLAGNNTWVNPLDNLGFPGTADKFLSGNHTWINPFETSNTNYNLDLNIKNNDANFNTLYFSKNGVHDGFLRCAHTSKNITLSSNGAAMYFILPTSNMSVESNRVTYYSQQDTINHWISAAGNTGQANYQILSVNDLRLSLGYNFANEYGYLTTVKTKLQLNVNNKETVTISNVDNLRIDLINDINSAFSFNVTDTNQFQILDKYNSNALRWQIRPSGIVETTNTMISKGPHAHIYMSASTTTLNGSANIANRIDAISVLINSNMFDSPQSMRLRFTGGGELITANFKISGALSFYPTTTGIRDIVYSIYKNGVEVTGSRASITVNTANFKTQVNLQCEASLTTNDYLDIYYISPGTGPIVLTDASMIPINV